MRQSRAEQAREFAQRRGFAQKVEHGHCTGGLSLRLRAFSPALRGPPAISQIAVLSAVIDPRYSGESDIMHFLCKAASRWKFDPIPRSAPCPDHLAPLRGSYSA